MAPLDARGRCGCVQQAEPNKFHDDKSLYTGTHVQGGPTNVDNVITLSNLADRSSADVRGLPKRLSDEGKPKFDRAEKGGYAAVEPAGGSPKKAALSSQSSFKAEKRISGSYTGGSLQDVFDDFCSFGAGSSGKPVNQMDGAKFVKLCKDCGLVDKKFTTTARPLAGGGPADAVRGVQSVDLVFSKVKPKGERKITFSQFQAALAAIAESKGCSAADVEAKVVAAKGPSSSGTVAEAVKFHDDKALYTGVHAKGGPTTVDNKITLSSLADRTASDIRGIKINDKY
ncbi:hypothetical protein KFL_002830120 [Klebsormidium nitens]|uniref:Uncharacterized protein n=1 Tax=Klebsormidium nitens TaxID=105231 RepID=A0A1Y1I5V3_KLENI|nr:hypothetical protein KFL_002830120 [Klebsormidium nitens]|eukprot:GAQ86335.1 hypothetical protein KFL_002830120 [Klebsormidium nitens]